LSFSNFKLPEGIIDSTLNVSSNKMVHNKKEDSKGALWFSTNAGLFSYSKNILINIFEKLIFQLIISMKYLKIKKGALWVSTRIGLCNIKENKITNITGSKIKEGRTIASVAAVKMEIYSLFPINIFFTSNG
jgi:ligand-binding sensor domain-containing protein